MRFLVPKQFWFSLYRTKIRLLVDVFRIFGNFILRPFFNRVLELSNATEKQRRSKNFCMGTSAKTLFGLDFISKKVVSYLNFLLF